MSDSILIKITPDNDFMAFSTYCRARGRKGRFLMDKARLQRALADEGITVYDSDCGSHMSIFVHNGVARITFDWLSLHSNDNIMGYRQRFEMPACILADAMASYKPVRYLYQSHEPQARIDCSRATRTIRNIQTDKLAFSAFKKALRDRFKWKGDTVYLYSDGKQDFTFSCESGCPAFGGLIYHMMLTNTRHGVVEKHYYGIHT